MHGWIMLCSDNMSRSQKKYFSTYHSVNKIITLIFSLLWFHMHVHIPSLWKEPISLCPISPYTERGNVNSISSSWFMAVLCWKWDEMCSSMLPSTIKQSWSELVWPESQLGRKPLLFVEPAQVVGMLSSISSTPEDAVSTSCDEQDGWFLLSSSSSISLLFWNP